MLYSLDGRCLSRYSAYEFALGIKSVCWSPSSQFLAIGSFDEKVMPFFFVVVFFRIYFRYQVDKIAVSNRSWSSSLIMLDITSP